MNTIIRIIDYKGRKESGVYNLNYLGKYSNVYVMDNHKMAYWCWLQEIKEDQNYSLIHIDRHTDCLNSHIGKWTETISELGSLKNMKPGEVDELTYNHGSDKFPLFRWDNYLPIFLKTHGELVTSIQMVTNHEGDIPTFSSYVDVKSPYNLANDIKKIFEHTSDKIILNIDIDYFVAVKESGFVNIFSEDYIEFIFDIIVENYLGGRIEVITFALSPECSGGWQNSINLVNRILFKFEMKLEEI